MPTKEEQQKQWEEDLVEDMVKAAMLAQRAVGHRVDFPRANAAALGCFFHEIRMKRERDLPHSV